MPTQFSASLPIKRQMKSGALTLALRIYGESGGG
jgi:hypothetical protein